MIKFFQSISSKLNNVAPIKVLTIGDSISLGTSDGFGAATENTLFEFHSNTLKLIPEGEDINSSPSGSPYPAMATRLKELNGRVMHLIPNGSSGAEFSPYLDNNNWSTLGTLYQSMINEVDNYFSETGFTSLDVIRITLGINDARGTASILDIENDAISLINRLNVDFPNTPIIMNNLYRGSRGATVSRIDSVRSIINDLISNNENIFNAKDLNNFNPSLFYDDLHLSQTGNNQLGIFDADIINNII